jgi:hypothetical protein
MAEERRGLLTGSQQLAQRLFFLRLPRAQRRVGCYDCPSSKRIRTESAEVPIVMPQAVTPTALDYNALQCRRSLNW